MTFPEQEPIDGTPLANLKAYLRITDTAQDAHLSMLLTAADAAVLKYLGTAIVAAEVTESVQVGRNEGFLQLRNRPVSTTADMTITGPEGGDIGASSFTLMAASGMLTTGTGVDLRRYLLTPGTWTVTYTGGLSLRADYATIAENVATATMLKAADLYSNRNPRATAERDGDVSVSLGTPDYFDDLLGAYRSR